MMYEGCVIVIDFVLSSYRSYPIVSIAPSLCLLLDCERWCWDMGWQGYQVMHLEVVLYARQRQYMMIPIHTEREKNRTRNDQKKRRRMMKKDGKYHCYEVMEWLQ